MLECFFLAGVLFVHSPSTGDTVNASLITDIHQSGEVVVVRTQGSSIELPIPDFHQKLQTCGDQAEAAVYAQE